MAASNDTTDYIQALTWSAVYRREQEPCPDGAHPADHFRPVAVLRTWSDGALLAEALGGDYTHTSGWYQHRWWSDEAPQVTDEGFEAAATRLLGDAEWVAAWRLARLGPHGSREDRGSALAALPSRPQVRA